ncbi:MAG: hypothetical protein R2827_12340 [Bdellovibrionales bacterium]
MGILGFFEDNVTSPKVGDRDYNDAVFNYKIAEQYNSYNQLVRIFIELGCVKRSRAITTGCFYTRMVTHRFHFSNI